jgi:aconitate hydratase
VPPPLRTACRKFGVHFSRAGNGVSHPVHRERFGKPGLTLLGSDSHTSAAGSLGMLAMGAGGMVNVIRRREGEGRP